ncbi:MAG TPA: glycosyltransferase [Candidatus Binatia bacterium]|nr:glycosyltransferase [Candidatus Binatia bacterium]
MTLTDNVGVIQHAVENVPNRKFGYCTDDVARAFMVTLAYPRAFGPNPACGRTASTCLSFLHYAQLDDGRFHNFMGYDRTWLDEAGSQDSCGRAIWALGFGIENAEPQEWRRVCRAMLDRALPSLDSLEYLRSRAYAALGFAHAYAALRDERYAAALRRLAGEIADAYDATAGDDWRWFEEAMTYDNARLPQALLRAGHALGDERFGRIGLSALAFYEGVTIENGIHVPIGNDGWYRRGGRRARYAQQPLEACAMVDAELAAFDLTSESGHLSAAEVAFAWYYGKNSREIAMAHGGGCYDGLDEDSVNLNMGAESTLALLSAACALRVRQTSHARATGNDALRGESR